MNEIRNIIIMRNHTLTFFSCIFLVLLALLNSSSHGIHKDYASKQYLVTNSVRKGADSREIALNDLQLQKRQGINLCMKLLMQQFVIWRDFFNNNSLRSSELRFLLYLMYTCINSSSTNLSDDENIKKNSFTRKELKIFVLLK